MSKGDNNKVAAAELLAPPFAPPQKWGIWVVGKGWLKAAKGNNDPVGFLDEETANSCAKSASLVNYVPLFGSELVFEEGYAYAKLFDASMVDLEPQFLAAEKKRVEAAKEQQEQVDERAQLLQQYSESQSEVQRISGRYKQLLMEHESAARENIALRTDRDTQIGDNIELRKANEELRSEKAILESNLQSIEHDFAEVAKQRDEAKEMMANQSTELMAVKKQRNAELANCIAVEKEMPHTFAQHARHWWKEVTHGNK